MDHKVTEKKIEVEEIEKAISRIEAEESRELVMKNFKRFSDDPENIDLQVVWKVLKNISPKFQSSTPTAKLNHKGKLISNSNDLKKLLAKEYKQRLQSRPSRPDLGDLKERRNEIFEMYLKLAENTPSAPWTMADLDRALSCLKNNKSRDHAGYANELFKSGVIGSDMKNSLLLMFNRLKFEKLIPSFMRYANITTVPKRGSLFILENERGIFRVNIIRSILMRMV